MELDTGSAVSIISFYLYQRKFNRLPLHQTELLLKTYTGENIFPAGVFKVPVDYQNQREWLDLYVVKNMGPVLMGGDWLRKIRLDWCSIKSLQACNAAEVRSFLGLVIYYNRFLPNLLTVVHPLNQLLENNHQWKWKCERNDHLRASINTL